ncbi:MAG: EAL domain-containing protein [Chloroflexaceae bacterium]|nr:EAL domain-containing protein [Chloroflexaceae bacterium]
MNFESQERSDDRQPMTPTSHQMLLSELVEQEALFRSVLDYAPDIMYLVDITSQKIIYANRQEIFGYAIDELVYPYFTPGSVTTEERELLQKHWQRVLQDRRSTVEYRVRDRWGRCEWVQNRALMLPSDGQQRADYVLVVLTIITQRKKLEHTLREHLLRLDGIINLAMDAIAMIDANQQIILFNRAAEQIFGYIAADVVGEHIERLIPVRYHQYIHDYGSAGTPIRRGMKGFEDGVIGLRADGSEFPLDATIYQVNVDEQPFFAIILRDITDRLLVEEQLQHLVLHDELTGLPNRTLFVRRLQRTIEQSHLFYQRRLFAMMFVDIDHFRVINESLGHLAGDQLIREMAQRLEGCLDGHHTVARFSGDEFAILLEDVTDVTEATEQAVVIQQAVQSPFFIFDHEVVATVSIGIAINHREVLESAYQRYEDVLRDADTALHQAKSLGRARYVVFNMEMYNRARARLQVEMELRRAIERNELRVYYQPIVDLTTDRVMGFEALVRWQHPKRGIVMPSEFIGIAEESGLINVIDMWVWYEACRQVRAWQQEFPCLSQLSISVNVSGRAFTRTDLVQKVEEILLQTGLDPSCMKLELTEGVMIDQFETTINTLQQLRALHVELCVDDFGTGYSSLRYLQLFPIQIVKIDQSFVSTMDDNAESAAIAQATVLLSHALGLKVVAEGIETMEQIARLEAMGCEYGQGFIFSRALSSNDARRFLARYAE